MNYKVCSKCQQNKLVGDFHKNRSTKDGLSWWCKVCHLAAVCKYRANPANKQKISEYNQSPHRKAKNSEYTRQYRAKHQNKCKAKSAVLTAKRQKLLISPNRCSICGKSSILDAHHADYSKPLEIQWLCRKCHSNIKCFYERS